MATISNGTTTVTPTLVTGYEAPNPSGNLRHQLIGGGIRMSLRTAGLRVGTLTLLFADEAAAAAAVELHRTPGVFTLDAPERATVSMTYVLAEGGNVTRSLDDETRHLWHVHVDYQEVAG